MRAKRAKQYRKLMKQYALSFNFREPYQVLLDSEIILAASNFKMHLGKLLESTLSGSIKPMITQCSIRHLYALPSTSPHKESCISVAKAAERRRCGHHELETPLSELECILSVLDPKGSATNKHRYIVASQDGEVRARLREVPGVPLIYIARSVMILEPMGRRSVEVKEREERGRVRAGLKGGRGQVVGEKRRREEDGDDEASEVDSEMEGEEEQVLPVVKKRKIRGPKEPNPLSVKKAKKESKPVSRQVEDERAVIRNAAKRDPQAVEKAMDARTAVLEGDVNAIINGVRKRKRKRKPKEDLPSTSSGGVDITQD